MYEAADFIPYSEVGPIVKVNLMCCFIPFPGVIPTLKHPVLKNLTSLQFNDTIRNIT